MQNIRSIAVAGASGFVGSRLVETLVARGYSVIGLTRSEKSSQDPSMLQWRACDLFSLLQVEESVRGADAAVYLVHSMSPSAGLTQGRFEDMDLILADNFARACATVGVQHIIYLGGLIPEDESLSRHLRSRAEVESVFERCPVPATMLRAGLIIGPRGSSFTILRNLVARLPAMILPAWTKTPTQPVSLEDTVDAIVQAIDDPECRGRTYDIGVPEPMTYRAMIEGVARAMGRRIPMIDVPWVSPSISTLWVSLFGGQSLALTGPLIESLRHTMVVREPHRLSPPGRAPRTFKAVVEEAVQAPPPPPRFGTSPRQSRRSKPALHDVRSVQRLPLPPGARAVDVRDAYLAWLPQFFRHLIHVVFVSETSFRFHFLGIRAPALVLEVDSVRSTPDRQLLRIRGGWLDKDSVNGRLEFREALGGQYILAAIHDYYPRLPWPVYKFTQARFHTWVMNAFGRYLASSQLPMPRRGALE